MRILIYKRTHIGDPNLKGEFGNEGCMGRVRGFAFDAVIGVGGISGQPVRQGLALKINWVGRHPIVSKNTIDPRGPAGDIAVRESGLGCPEIKRALLEFNYITHTHYMSKRIFGLVYKFWNIKA